MSRTADIVTALADQLMASGLFTTVNSAEPPTDTGGLTAACWPEAVTPHARASGLASTTGVIRMKVRIYLPATAAEPDHVERAALDAADEVIGMLSGAFTLGGLVESVDLLGRSGAQLAMTTAWLGTGGALRRIVDITVPLIVSDLWEQVP